MSPTNWGTQKISSMGSPVMLACRRDPSERHGIGARFVNRPGQVG
jgi:hypothetical protein